MKGRAHSRLLFVVVGVLTLTLTASALFSLAQQGLPPDSLDPLAIDTQVYPNVWITQRVPHPVCPNCFRVADRYGILEEVPGTGKILSRDLPDPAPLQPGEVRPEFDEEGAPIWYIDNQGFVGPTDEELVSPEIPYPKIDLERIQARHENKVFSIREVHGIGIGGKGFIVLLEPKHLKNQFRIPTDLEGVPVDVEMADRSVSTSHEYQQYSPVPLGVGIQNNFDGARSTLGPHIVRDIGDIGTCCQIWSLTAAHSVKDLSAPPPIPGSPASVIYQGSFSWGNVVHAFQLTPCDTPGDPDCNSPSAPINDTRVRPDVAAIAHINVNHMDPYPHVPPCSGSIEPVRRMQYGINDFVHGPTGIIRITSMGTSIKVWSAFNDAPVGSVDMLDTTFVYLSRGRQYKLAPIDRATLERRGQGGDSGSLVAWNGERHVTGLAVASLYNPILKIYSKQEWYIRADFIKAAFRDAGKSFSHYWGTSLGMTTIPANTQYDKPCS